MGPTLFPTDTPISTQLPVDTPTLRPTTNNVDTSADVTMGPTLSLSSPPPSSQGQTIFTCADFQQGMVFDRLVNNVELSMFRPAMARELQQLTSSYLPGFAVTTAANVDDIVQGETMDANNIPATSTYELCYSISVDSDGVAEIETFPFEFVSYLGARVNRSPFEDRLQAAGIPIIDGSLKAPTLMMESPPNPPLTETKSSNAAAIGGAVAGVVVLLAVAVVLYHIRRRNASSQPDLPNTRSDDLPEDELSPRDDNAGPTASNIPMAQVIGNFERGAPQPNPPKRANTESNSDSYQVNYKDQGQTVDHERSVHQKPPPPRTTNDDYEVDYKDQGQTVEHERSVHEDRKPPARRN